MQWMALAEVQVKRSVILTDRSGPDIFSTLRMKGQVLHCARAHYELPSINKVIVSHRIVKHHDTIIFQWTFLAE